MNIFKRVSTFALTLAMVFTAVLGIGATTAFAAEVTPEEQEIVETFSVSEEAVTISPRATGGIANDTFNISGYHRGASRVYNCNYVWIYCTFTNTDGSYLENGSTILAARLYDDTTGAFINEWQSSSGLLHQANIPVVSGHSYHWEYLVAYGTQNLRLHCQLVGSDFPVS